MSFRQSKSKLSTLLYKRKLTKLIICRYHRFLIFLFNLLYALREKFRLQSCSLKILICFIDFGKVTVSMAIKFLIDDLTISISTLRLVGMICDY